jgi:hypothetical protein
MAAYQSQFASTSAGMIERAGIFVSHGHEQIDAVETLHPYVWALLADQALLDGRNAQVEALIEQAYAVSDLLNESSGTSESGSLEEEADLDVK